MCTELFKIITSHYGDRFISMQSINFTYMKAFLCVCAHLGLKRSEQEHMGRVGVFWQRRQQRKKICYSSYLPVRFSVWNWECHESATKSIWFLMDFFMKDNVQHFMFIQHTEQHIMFIAVSRILFYWVNYLCWAVTLLNSRNYRRPNPLIILFYWSSCLWRKTLCWTFICLFLLRGWTNTNSNSLHSGTYTHRQRHKHTHTHPCYWVQSESSFQTISLSNTLALTDRHWQIRRAMATVKCESRWWEECVCALQKLVG